MTRGFPGCRFRHQEPSKRCRKEVVALPYGSHTGVSGILTIC